MQSERLKRFREYMEKNNLKVTVVIDPENQYYFTNFYAVVYSRPIITLIFLDRVEMIVPELEKLHAQEESFAEKIYTYGEVPYFHNDAYTILKKILLDISGRIGIEENRMPLSLFRAIFQKFSVIDVAPYIEKMRMIKDDEEIKLIKKAAYLADIGVKNSIEFAKEDITELEIDAAGNHAILREAGLKFPNFRLSLFAMSPSGSQRTPLPHVFSTSRKLRKGDIIIHSRQVSLNGYRAECERTFFLRPLKKEHEEIFQVMIEAQKIAEKNVKDGIKAGEIDLIARKIIEENGYAQYFPHRTGHGVGLSVHEPPYIRFDSDTILRENMVITIEPGIYIPQVGGFRHSDTLIVRKNRGEILTNISRDLDYLAR
ncbi:MAG TPA: aminopeptidase P family protein [Candidatus Aciduliprofundum boonei]|uniref:Aminopeptidase P family protein n=1 Tax=Candidatus Aciduliprofundum boonei TaxID=379547 RepID=A0A7J3T927_9ARCH|nr:aminopeptidase P family protein [Candidatus Aciduliprofundum boonei]